MNTVTLNRKVAKARFLSAVSGKKTGNFISFESASLLFKLMTVKRWEILGKLTGKEAVSIREAARMVKRDVKAVHGDITVLLNAGILQKSEDRKINFPYDRLHVDFELIEDKQV